MRCFNTLRFSKQNIVSILISKHETGLVFYLKQLLLTEYKEEFWQFTLRYTRKCFLCRRMKNVLFKSLCSTVIYFRQIITAFEAFKIFNRRRRYNGIAVFYRRAYGPFIKTKNVSYYYNRTWRKCLQSTETKRGFWNFQDIFYIHFHCFILCTSVIETICMWGPRVLPLIIAYWYQA